ncbi:hypothetical protein TrST_g13391 [Triparma strigata]|uniref:Zeta toxin domain-containing protein n=1 Tax=Triparma strigata TaxID=1606541 RepID=A0A9W7BZ93_9STRA|nr:hypothetical protein TrST_g13391 [Triparma strigata]
MLHFSRLSLGTKALRRSILTFPSTRFASNFNLSYPNSNRPVFVFMSGCPGAGKTHALHKVYDLSNVKILDLDQVITTHSNYDKTDAAKIYKEKTAYDWADTKIEESFQEVLRDSSTRDNNPNARIHALDGTGANHERTIRRMREAKAVGFWIVLLYVKVNVETALRRNEQRNRRVPEDEIRDYVPSVEEAFSIVMKTDLVDELIVLNNDEDDLLTDEERWGRFQKRIEEDSRWRAEFMDW